MSVTLATKTMIVTGGSKGIGLAAARSLLDRGANVAIFARNQQGLERAAAALASDRLLPLAVDLTDRTAVEEACRKVVTHFGRLDGIVNNVGFQFARKIEKVGEEELRTMVELNFFSVVFGCQAAIPLLRENGGGRIVNISSSSVRNDNEFAHLAMYSSSKAAVDHFTRELRREVQCDKIDVTLLSPGAVATGSSDNFEPEAMMEAYDAWLEKDKHFDGALDVAVVGQAIAQCFEYPAGTVIEFLEIRPNTPTPKTMEGGLDQL